MKRGCFILLALLWHTAVLGQVDQHGNPVFNSEGISEERFENFELTSSYYTIRNNISNPGSSVFVSATPTVEDYLKFSRDLPSYFFIVHKGMAVVAMIMLVQVNEGGETKLTYHVVNPETGRRIEVPCGVFGEISEKRVDELEQLKADSESKIIEIGNGKSYLFGGIVYRIQPYDKVKAEVTELAKLIVDSEKKEKPQDPVAYIKRETIGGKLDFNIILENKTEEAFMVDGVIYSKKDFAIYLWGGTVRDLGIKTPKAAIKLWEEIANRALSEPEKIALTKGFEKVIE